MNHLESIVTLLNEARLTVASWSLKEPNEAFWPACREKINEMENILLTQGVPKRCDKLDTSLAEFVVRHYPSPEDSERPELQILCRLGNAFCSLELPQSDDPIEQAAITHFHKYNGE